MKARIPYKMSSKERKAMNDEINRQLLERDAAFSMDFDSTVLWALRVCFGFGKKRLRKFWNAFSVEHQQLREYYQMAPKDDGWLCRRKLKQIGVDVEQWYKEKEC